MTYALLLDVSSLMYRAFFAWGRSSRSPGGRPVGAVHGYLDMVTRLIVTRRPDEVVHVYDHEWRPVARTDMYAGYKANRRRDPEGLPEQFPMLRQVLDLTGMSQAMTRGWEAEDAIGAICATADPTDRLEIVSGDRDLIQLVRDPAVKLLFTLRGVSELLDLDEAGVLEKYGVPGVPVHGVRDPARRRERRPARACAGSARRRRARWCRPTGRSRSSWTTPRSSEPRPGPLKGKPALRARLARARRLRRDDAAARAGQRGRAGRPLARRARRRRPRRARRRARPEGTGPAHEGRTGLVARET